jgi:hypothetical protein
MRSSSSEDYGGCSILQRHVRPRGLRDTACVSSFLYRNALTSFRISKNLRFYGEKEAPLF